MPLILVPYTMGSEMGVAATAPLGGAAYYRKRSWWWVAACLLLCLVR